MKQLLVTALLFFGYSYSAQVLAQDQGETLFNQTCVACHTIGEGKLIGPDLVNMHTRRDEAWLIRFIQESPTMVAEGDADAVALFEEYGQVPMPPHPFSDDQVRAIIGYVARMSPAGATPSANAVDEGSVEISESTIQEGLDLFVGKTRFQEGAAACNSCHHVNTDAVMTGGALAKDLTAAYSRLTGPGIRAMINAPPFPMMRTAYEGKAITEEEASALIAFLQSADREAGSQEIKNYGSTMLYAGLAGIAVLLGFFSIVGMRSTKNSINQPLYDRQKRTS